MSPVQVLSQFFLFVLMCFSTVLVVIAFQHRGRPWQRGLPGLGGAVFYLGYALNLINADTLHFDAAHRYDIMCIYIGITLMSIPRMSVLFADMWHERPSILRRHKHPVAGD